MQQAFHHGGWGMYPTTVAGLILFVAAIQYARQPDRRRLGIVRTLAGLTFLVSTLGFITGLIKSFTAAGQLAPQDFGDVVIGGIGESLNNLGLGLALLVIATIVTAIGRARTGSSPADLTDPHAP
jgi:hypothetical protein